MREPLVKNRCTPSGSAYIILVLAAATTCQPNQVTPHIHRMLNLLTQAPSTSCRRWTKLLRSPGLQAFGQRIRMLQLCRPPYSREPRQSLSPN